MGSKLWWAVFPLFAAFLLGVGSAGGRSLTTTTVVVDVIGQGTVTSAPSSIKCGNGKKTCYVTFTTGATVTLTAAPAGGWAFDHWDDKTTVPDCNSATTTTCDVTLDGASHVLIANFTGPPTTQSTLTVTYDATNGDGDVTGPESATPGSGIDCGSTGVGTMCTWTVLTGSTLTVFETPATGRVFSGWGGACSGINASCTLQMGGDQAVSAAWAGAGNTKLLTVSVSGNGKVQGGGINCPSTCSASEPLNSSVTLTATPDDGYVFSTWGGLTCSGASPTCTFTMTKDTDVGASFVAAATLTVAVNGNGNVSGGSGAINCGSGANVCSANFAANATVTLIATPALGATFAGWTGACGGTAITCTVAMSASKSVNANFLGGTAGTLLTVSVSGLGTVTGGGINCGNGAFTCSANETANSTVTLTETPGSGATFSGWGGACSGTTTTCTVSMTSAMTVTATFTGGTALVSLSVSVSGNGTVTGGGINCGNGATTCSVSVPAGSSITLTATPASGASFTRWSGACSGSARTCSVTLSVSAGVSATFSGGAGVTLTLAIRGRGTVSSSAGVCGSTGPKRTCAQHFAAGASVVLTQAPLPGAKFLGWGGACTGATKICVLRLTGAKLVTATFSGATGRAVLTALASPLVRHTARGFRVTLRFGTTEAGRVHVRALRAGRVVTALSLRVGKGAATIGPFPVLTPGAYTFEIVLGSHALHWRTCLGRCGAAAPGVFAVTRQPPDVLRSGDAWSVTLRFRQSLIFDAHVRVYRRASLLTDHQFLGRAGEIAVGPFLLAPGNYTLRLTVVDPYGRVRTLTWLVALAR